MARPDHAHRGRRAVLLVVRVQDEQHAQGADGLRVADVGLGRDGEHHPQEVRLVVERVVGVHVGLADGLLVRGGRDGRQLGEQPHGGQLDVRLVERIAAVLVERGQRADRRAEDRHRVGVHREGVEEVPELLADEGVALDLADPGVQLLGIRQVAVDQQVGDLEERRALGQLLDRIAAVAQDPVVAVEVRDGAAGGRRVRVAVVEGDQPGVLEQRRDVDRRLALGRGLDREHELTLAHLEPGNLCLGGRTRSLHRRHRCLALPSAGAHPTVRPGRPAALTPPTPGAARIAAVGGIPSAAPPPAGKGHWHGPLATVGRDPRATRPGRDGDTPGPRGRGGRRCAAPEPDQPPGSGPPGRPLPLPPTSAPPGAGVDEPPPEPPGDPKPL